MAMLKPGDLIWAKMKGHPHWPAMILSSTDVPLPCPTGKQPVLFYGTNETAFLRPQDLFAYELNRAQYEQPRKHKGFNQAIREIRREAGIEESADFDRLFPIASVVTTVKRPVGRPNKNKDEDGFSSSDDEPLVSSPSKAVAKAAKAPRAVVASKRPTEPERASTSVVLSASAPSESSRGRARKPSTILGDFVIGQTRKRKASPPALAVAAPSSAVPVKEAEAVKSGPTKDAPTSAKEARKDVAGKLQNREVNPPNNARVNHVKKQTKAAASAETVGAAVASKSTVPSKANGGSKAAVAQPASDTAVSRNGDVGKTISASTKTGKSHFTVPLTHKSDAQKVNNATKKLKEVVAAKPIAEGATNTHQERVVETGKDVIRQSGRMPKKKTFGDEFVSMKQFNSKDQKTVP